MNKCFLRFAVLAALLSQWVVLAAGERPKWHDDLEKAERLAQEVETEFPELVSMGGPGTQYKTLSYNRFSAVLLQGVKELDAENQQLRNDLAALSARIEALENN